MAKRITTLLIFAAVLAGLAALPSCDQRREDDDSSAVQGDQGEPEFVVAVVLDVSGSYLTRIQGDSPQAYKFFMKLTTAYANDRGESGDRILISQISQADIPLLYEGTPRRLRSDFPGPGAFRKFVLDRSNANGSRVYAGVAAAIERVLQFPGVQAGTTRSAVFVLSDLDDNAADGPAQKKRLLEALGRYAKGAGGSRTTNHSDGGQETWSRANGKVVTNGESDSAADGEQASVGGGRGEALDIRNGMLMNRFPTFNSNEGKARTSQRAHTNQSSEADSVVVSSGGGRSWSDGTADAANWNTVDTANWTESESQGQGLTLAYKLMTLAKIVREKQRTGQLEMSVADQFERLKQQIHGLRPRFCLVKLPDEPKAFLAEVAAVREFYATPTARQRAIQAVKEQLAGLRPYYVEDEAEEMMAPNVAPPPSSGAEIDEENPIA